MPFGAKETQTLIIKVSNSAKIKNRYNQVPHLTQDIDGKVTNSQSDTSVVTVPFLTASLWG